MLERAIYRVEVTGLTRHVVPLNVTYVLPSSPLSNIFGLAVDRVLEYEIIVPTGDLLVANECQNPAPSFHRLVNSVSTTFKPTTSIERFFEFVILYSAGWASDDWSRYIYTAGLFHLSKLETTEDKALTYMAPLKTFPKKS
ncbi:hypothetical protein EDD85DRAFT_957465 [Armillaria nabsnona]|nr:hypothetical protein EDD85DRAFT_957465 [Armillaria nabsnona]